MHLYVQKMLTEKDTRFVFELLLKSGFHPVSVIPERIILSERAITTKQFKKLKNVLQLRGFNLIPETFGHIVMTVKAVVMEHIHDRSYDQSLDINFTAHLSFKLNKAYTQISHIFSTIEGQTIKQFIIQQKTERVKTLLHQNLTLTDVAIKMSYSSVQHLSLQFKKVTGITPTEFKERNILATYS